jgi:hypothetical protein
MGIHHKLGSAENYTIGGLRFFFDELVGSQYQGYLYLGNVVTGGLTPTVDNLDHFTAKSGKRLKDRRVTREVSMAFNITLDEPNVSAMNLFMFGAGITDIAASPTVSVTAAPFVASDNEPFTIPQKGASAIVVSDSTPTVAVLGTDYTVTDMLGYKQIKRISTSTVLIAGEACTVAYTYAQPAAKTFKPATRTLREGRALVQGVSDIGNEFEYAITKCSLAPSGDWTLNDQDWSQFQFALEILDNSAADVNAPFGTMTHHGTGQDI